MKRIFQFSIWMVVATLAMINCNDDKKVPVTALNLTGANSVEIVVGNTHQILVSVEPSNATDQGLIWTSSNSNVASVLGGVVTALMTGETEIVATTVDGAQSVSMRITVTNPILGIAFRGDLLICLDETTFPTYGFLPPSATKKPVKWSSDDPSVVSINAATGEMTGMKLGTATITAVLVENEEIRSSCSVEVALIPVTGVKLTPKTLLLLPGGTETLQYATIPANAYNKGVTWSSSDETIVSVDPATGLITAVTLEKAEATITVTTDDGGFKDFCHVTVDDPFTGTKFVRVDADRVNWTGKYLLVYEAQATGAGTYAYRTVLAFNSAGTNFDGAGNVYTLSDALPANNRDLTPITGGVVTRTATDVTVTGGQIVLTEDFDAAAVKILPVEGGGWAIQTSDGYYLGGAAQAGALSPGGQPGTPTKTFDPNVHVHEISIKDSNSPAAADEGIIFHGCAIIKSNTTTQHNYVRVNGGTGRFGYWGTGLMAPVALYRLE